MEYKELIMNWISIVIGLGSLVAGIASLILAWKVKKDSDERERAIVPGARSLTDLSQSYLDRLTIALGEKDRNVIEYNSVNHTIVCILGQMSKKFAISWVENQKNEDDKLKWKRIFGLIP
jgi:hypothetical protein